MNIHARQKQSHRYKKQATGHQRKGVTDQGCESKEVQTTVHKMGSTGSTGRQALPLRTFNRAEFIKIINHYAVHLKLIM